MTTNKFACRLSSGLKTLLIIASIAMLMLISSCKPKETPKEERYVVLSPEVAEIMAALNLTDKIVGLTAECNYPAELASIPKVGRFGAVRKEAMLKLEPTVVFVAGLEQEAIAEELEKLNIKVVTVYPQSIDELYAAITNIGQITGTQQRAKTLIEELKAAIAAIQRKTDKLIKPKVYLEINRDPLMSVSDESFVGQLLELAGGDNIFPTLEREYARVKPEDVINAAPDIIICYSRDSVNNIINRKGWQDIPAIKNGYIYTHKDVDPDIILRAGPRIHLGLKRLQDLYLAWEKDQRP